MTPQWLVLLIGFVFLPLFSAAQNPKETADRIRAHDKANPKALNPQCKLYAAADLFRFTGEAMGSPENSTGGCTWPPAKEDPDSAAVGVMITVVPARYHSYPKGSPDFRALPAVGKQGYAAKSLGDWVAGAIAGEHAIVVTLSCAKATEAKTVALLEETIKRLPAIAGALGN